jgi:hypothetical protein
MINLFSHHTLPESLLGFLSFVLLYRRLLLDDSKGVAEALNETVCVLDKCTGLTVSTCYPIGIFCSN